MKKSFVRFRTQESSYIVPVDVVREVMFAREVMPLPSPQKGVAGLLQRGEDVITVLSVLCDRGDRVIVVLDARGLFFGLLAEEVVGVVAYDDEQIEPAPPGQVEAIVEGLVVMPEHVDMLISPARVWAIFGTE